MKTTIRDDAESKLALELAEGLRTGELAVFKYIPPEKTAETMGRLGLLLASGQPYETVRILPSEIWGQMYGKPIRAGGHVVIGKLSPEEKAQRKITRKVSMAWWETEQGERLGPIQGVMMSYGQNP